MQEENILVWLPSPMGDAVLCTPALRALRLHFKSAKISFLARPAVRQILSPCRFCDSWLVPEDNSGLITAIKLLKAHRFTQAILFKNSFGSVLAVSLAAIPVRIGYVREGRGILLTDKLYPPKLPDGRFKPVSMLDYYLAIASWLGAETEDRTPELSIEPQATENLRTRLPQLTKPAGPLIIMVPGGAFGPSKCWPAARFAQTADRLIAGYNATVVISVSDHPFERQIAEEICGASKYKLINLAENPVGLGELKSLFSMADLVISNDTGPRHIAIALQRKIVSLFGPNDPAWTETGYENEIKIISDVPCAPCARPLCKETQHLCMQAITVEMVCSAAERLLENNKKRPQAETPQKFTEVSESFFIDSDYKTPLTESGLTSIDAVFSFNKAENLTKDNLAGYRSRLRFMTDSSPPRVMFLKRYDHPPVLFQLKNWLLHRKRISCGICEIRSAEKLASAGINTPKTIAYGQKWGLLFEKRSFIITEKIPDAQSLESELPDYFNAPVTAENLKLRRNFITHLARFIKKFHETNYRHRDLYLSHIFYRNPQPAPAVSTIPAGVGEFYLIDLARVFKPTLSAERLRTKDIAQIHYSAPAEYFSKTDRLRFYLALIARTRLTEKDKLFINKVIKKANRMARHDIKHNRPVPFTNRPN